MIDDRAAGSPDADLMRQVRRRWASGVAVVATRDHKEMIGTTVSAFSVLSLDPPLVLICLYEEGRIASVVGRTRRFSVSILDIAQESLADRFAGRGPALDSHFTGVRLESTREGEPALAGAICVMDCVVKHIHEGGDHSLIVATAVEVRLMPDTDDPLLTYEGQYRRLASS